MEVVLALGVIGFAIVAILGILPVGLNTGRSAQDETRAAQIAQTILEGMGSQASAQFTGVKVPVSSGNQTTIDLSQSTSTPAAPALQLYADNDGQISQAAPGAAFSIKLITNNAPAGFDSGYANQVTVNVAWPAAAATASQTVRSFSRVMTKY